MSLEKYRAKRDFRKTSEPQAGRKPRKGKGAGKTAREAYGRFVIQKHDASRLHYDLRLEIDGVLKSWAVPKGLPFKAGVKRLAVHVEDHPLAYIDFEGTIPQGSYGGGTVMVWDEGTFQTPHEKPTRELAQGKLHFILQGKKLQGEWYLVRMHDKQGSDDQWLVIKSKPGMSPVSKKMDDTSAITGRSMKQIAQGHASPRKKVTPKKTARKKKDDAEADADEEASSKAQPLPDFIEPMKALLVDKPPAGQWQYETKLDGYRALAIIEGGKVRLVSRNRQRFDGRFPQIIPAVEALRVDETILDGEVVVVDEQGLSTFEALQAWQQGNEQGELQYVVFDLPWLQGHDLTQQPLEDRQALLDELLKDPPPRMTRCPHHGSDARKALAQARRLGLEGLIGKRAGSVYETGRRSGAWVKLKLVKQQEFVIGGYSPPSGSRSHFGALLVGVYEKRNLIYSGKVGTGYDERSLAALHEKLKPLETDVCPFENLRDRKQGDPLLNVSHRDFKRMHWVRPKLVAEVKFSNWTREGLLRQPVFLALRQDKPPAEVVREEPHQLNESST